VLLGFLGGEAAHPDKMIKAVSGSIIFDGKKDMLVLRPLCIDGPVSHRAVRCGFIFMSHSGSMAIINKAADDRLKAHPKGVNQRAQLGVLAVRHGTTMASQPRLDLSALDCAGPSIQSGRSTRDLGGES